LVDTVKCKSQRFFASQIHGLANKDKGLSTFRSQGFISKCKKLCRLNKEKSLLLLKRLSLFLCKNGQNHFPKNLVENTIMYVTNNNRRTFGLNLGL